MRCRDIYIVRDLFRFLNLLFLLQRSLSEWSRRFKHLKQVQSTHYSLSASSLIPYAFFSFSFSSSSSSSDLVNAQTERQNSDTALLAEQARRMEVETQAAELQVPKKKKQET